MNTAALLRPIAFDFDLSSLRFPGERELRQEVEKRPTILAVVHQWAKPGAAPRLLPAGFPKGGIVAGPALSPALHRLGAMLRQLLRLEFKPELVVFPGREPLVELLPRADEPRAPIRLAVTAGVFDRVWTREALFVLGRALGRRLLDQLPLVGDPTAGVDKRDQETLLLRGLWKFQELSCDRIGLICCQSFETAARTILKLASGLPDDLLQPDLAALLASRIAEEEAMVADHPYEFTMLRVAALEQFAAGEKYAAALATPAIEALPIPVEMMPKDALPAPVAPSASPTTAVEPPMAAYEVPEPAPDTVPELAEFEPLPDDTWPEKPPIAMPAVLESAAPPVVDTALSPAAPAPAVTEAPPMMEAAAAPTLTPDSPAPLASPTLPVVHTAPPPTQPSVVAPRLVRELVNGQSLPSVRFMFSRKNGKPATALPIPPAAPTLPPSGENPPLPADAAGPSNVESAAIELTPSPATLSATPPPIAARAEMAAIERFDEPRQRFALAGTLWVMGSRPELNERARAVLHELYGADVEAAIEETATADGLDAYATLAHDLAANLAGEDRAERLRIVEDILHAALAGGELSAVEHHRLLALAERLDLTPDDVAGLAAEYIDPEFAGYEFQLGQEVEVRLDGEWVVGKVRKIEPAGDLRIHFPETDEVLWLSSKADLIRPALLKHVG